MSDGIAASLKHALKMLGRRTPIVSRAFRHLDALAAERDRAAYDLEQSKAARDKAIRERLVAEAALQVATGRRAAGKTSSPDAGDVDTVPSNEEDTTPIDPSAMKVVMPASAEDTKGLLLSSIFDDDPVVFLEHRWLHNVKGDVPAGDHRVPLGKARVLREGDAATIVAMCTPPSRRSTPPTTSRRSASTAT